MIYLSDGGLGGLARWVFCVWMCGVGGCVSWLLGLCLCLPMGLMLAAVLWWLVGEFLGFWLRGGLWLSNGFLVLVASVLVL